MSWPLDFRNFWLKIVVLAFLLLALPVAGSAEWKLLWSDEFNRAKDTPPDPAKWTHDLGGGGWGNHELEVYTSDPRNASHDGAGHLAIRVYKEGDSRYTSARIKTQGKYDWKYGKIEARIKIPFGQGIWGAFWMLGKDFPSVRWPQSSEIDLMENIGKEPSMVHGTIHGPGYSGKDGISSAIELPRKRRFADDFHRFGAEWSPNLIELFLDGRRYARITPAQLPVNAQWVFDQPTFLLLNVAVGGDWPGPPDQTTTFPQTMLVDWIRVWRSVQ